MDKWFYFTRATRFRLTILFIILCYILPWSLIGLLVIVYGVVFGLFYRKQVDFAERRVLEANLILSPVSGRLKSITRKEEKVVLNIYMAPYKDFGIYMPFYGEVRAYTRNQENLKEKSELVFKSRDKSKVKVCLPKRLIAPEIYVDSGDQASAGAYLGYLPLGGSVSIVIPKGGEILVKEGDILSSTQTILASIQDYNESTKEETR